MKHGSDAVLPPPKSNSNPTSTHECHICKKRFMHRHALYKHLRNVHNNSQSASNARIEHQTAKKNATKGRQDARKILKEKNRKEAKEKRQAIIQTKRQPKGFDFTRDIDRGEVCIKIVFYFRTKVSLRTSLKKPNPTEKYIIFIFYKKLPKN